MCAGIIYEFSPDSRTVSSKFLESNPSIGLPSDFIFPIASSLFLKFSAEFKFGTNTTW